MLAMASYAETGKSPRTLTEREQKLLLRTTGEHRAGYRDQCLCAIGRSLLLHRLSATVEVKTPFQTVRADFPHTAYRWSLGSQHYAASWKKGRLHASWRTSPLQRWSYSA